ncbi:ionotropic receptor 25a isoform X2 [Cimex lectularius]|uniref:Ionotropic receptor n=1 Tax=Cimex lectularius TaxID=79782 RepID=A0A8I6S780_CIMLE|nr:ionotropic receptor 25a isoform X2 [Cimex lectularius]
MLKLAVQVLLLYVPSVVPQTRSINVMFVNDVRNELADLSFQVALEYVKRNRKLGVHVEGITKVVTEGSDAKAILEDLCHKLNESSAEGKFPHLILDTTMTGVTSESVKTFTAALNLPTISGSFGQAGDLRQWRHLESEQLKNLIQINPPADIIPEIIRNIIQIQNITNAGILYDDSFTMEHKYKSLLLNMPTRHIIADISDARSVRQQLNRFRELDIMNFFILGRLAMVKSVLEIANILKVFGKKYAWHAITQDKGNLICACNNATILHVKPEPDPESKERLDNLRTSFNLVAEPEITSVFYFDLFLHAFLAISTEVDRNWPKDYNKTSCENYREEALSGWKTIDLRTALKSVQEPYTYAPFVVESNGLSYPEFNMRLEKVSIVHSLSESAESIGTWKAGFNSQIQLKDSNGMINISAITVYRIVTVKQKPFIIEYFEDGKTKYKGYCIDLIEEIRSMIPFEYDIYVAPDNSFGNMDENGNWNGMIKELIEKRAEIALGSLSVMAERENVVDFTVPYYDLVGITILMKKPTTTTSLFKFLTVLENEVWLCILAAYFFTSFLMWVFDRWSPYSYQNNREKYKDDEEKREFNLKECLWFCMTSLTPQGGGEAPKNLSGRLVAATWWLFGFIIIASYTANLAAFLTVSRLDTPIESLDDLAKQYKIRYAPVNGSAAMTYFERMASIEEKFYEIWKDMSLNDSLNEVERAKLAVWDYPVSDKYTKMWQAMKEAVLPTSLDDAVQRVMDSSSSGEGFAFLGDATDIKYKVMTSCDFQVVGDEFSRKPYAIAVQQGSPLKDQFNNAILQLLNKRKLEKLKEKWWTDNPERVECEKQEEQSDGISIHNIGGVFIVIFVGIALACITLGFEYWWYKFKKPAVDVQQGAVMVGKQTKTGAGGGIDKLSITGLADYTSQPYYRPKFHARTQYR